MDRRDFLKRAALFSAGALVSPPVFDLTGSAFAAAPPEPEVIAARGKDYPGLVRRAFRALGGMETFVSPSDNVVIKPNIGWDRTVEQAANTHPEVVKAVALMVLEAGAGSVTVFDRPCNEERRCYNNSGIKPAIDSIKDRRVSCVYMDSRKFIPVDIRKGVSLEKWAFYRDALEADCYINIPVAKHHGLAGLTLGMKNIMGILGGRRGRIHFDLDQNLADLNTVVKPDVTVVDATRILLRNGPQGGSLSDVRVTDTVIASADPVAADAYATTLFNMTPGEVGATKAAFKMGLGRMDLDKCRIRQIT